MPQLVNLNVRVAKCQNFWQFANLLSQSKELEFKSEIKISIEHLGKFNDLFLSVESSRPNCPRMDKFRKPVFDHFAKVGQKENMKDMIANRKCGR